MERRHEPKPSQGCTPPQTTGWKDIVRKYQNSSAARSAWQLGNTLVPYALLWVLMFHALRVSWWLVVPLAILAGAFLIRTFVIFHDCTHGSFFKSKRANEVTGFVAGLLTITPFHQWRFEHSVHHSAAGDLDRRGIGDVWTLTVQEYLAASRWRRFSYRVFRNPIVLFGIAPLLLFLVVNRIPVKEANSTVRRWVWITNLALLLMAGGLASVYGLANYLAIQGIAIAVASIAGVWLFYVQHQFEDVYWERRPDWDFAQAALAGSSFYRLPKVLQWFSGNIGYHHIHHLSPRIPNYRLAQAHAAEPMFQQVRPLTLRASVKSLGFRLWDEENRRLTGYAVLKGRARCPDGVE
ncbi:MAG: fatty acid desaturase [Verrucomicrobia bacterium]|nr:MAG: fatty acid desaturase [Verrucomicrobiota bacterium]TAE88327.1 MAG: fatty acid desaturase [Verrucomicrobiota bacterium]TAF26781.1 MAG: fatty acid desaturase [Verrucomicrobiota bacterium]TAF42038.1 MAG: fatty acid desaturase [Verrucomicrobiota bacterium]